MCVRPSDEELNRAMEGAAQARRLARSIGNDDARKTLLAIADDYDRLVTQLIAERENQSE